MTISSYIHGYDETAITDEQLAAIKEEWIAQRDLNLFYWAGEPEFSRGHDERRCMGRLCLAGRLRLVAR